MTPEEMQVIFEGGFQVVIIAFMIGFGIGQIIKLIMKADDK